MRGKSPQSIGTAQTSNGATPTPSSTPGYYTEGTPSSVSPLQNNKNQNPGTATGTTTGTATATSTASGCQQPETPWALGATATSTLGQSVPRSGSFMGNSIRIGMHVRESPSPNPPSLGIGVNNSNALGASGRGRQAAYATSDYQSRLMNQKSAEAVEAVLAASCAAMGFDIAEMWLRTGTKTHQLINSHLRHSALDETMRDQLVEVYYGDSASDRTHRLSPALCKKAKQDNDVVWVTAQTESGAKALKCSLNGVLTAVAVPVCHEASNSNITVIYFSVKRATMRPEAIEFLVHMSLAAAVAGVNTFNDDDASAREDDHDHDHDHIHGHHRHHHHHPSAVTTTPMEVLFGYGSSAPTDMQPLSSRQITESHAPVHVRLPSSTGHGRPMSAGLPSSEHPAATRLRLSPDHKNNKHKEIETSRGIRPVPTDGRSIFESSVTGANLNLTWSDLRNIEYLTDGGNNWIHTAVMNKTPIVIKQLKPEVQDVAVAINEIEGELAIHRLLNHKNIVSLFGAGFTSSKSRFIVMERLDGGTLTQVLGYDTRIRDRRRRFWKKNKLPYIKVLDCAKQIAEAIDYCHRDAVEGSMVLHRDLKPDNIGLTLSGNVKIIDFGLARVVDNASPNSNDVFEMSGETGSLRYMAPEVASCKPYNHKIDIYSFGMILWELVAYQKPFDGMNRDQFYEKVVHGGYRPEITKKFPEDLADVIQRCWSTEAEKRPNFDQIIEELQEIIKKEKEGKTEKKNSRFFGSLMGSGRKSSSSENKRKLIDRHSTWF